MLLTMIGLAGWLAGCDCMDLAYTLCPQQTVNTIQSPFFAKGKMNLMVERSDERENRQ